MNKKTGVIGGKLSSLRFLFLFLIFVFFTIGTLLLSQKKMPQNKKINKISQRVLSSLKADLNGDGEVEQIKLILIKDSSISTPSAELNVYSDKKLITRNSLDLEWKQGELEIFDLFNDKTKQIFVSSIVGAHSTIARLFKFDNGKLIPICLDQFDNNKNQVCEFFIDSNLYMPFSNRDLDGDGIKELFGQKKKNGKIEYTFYKWTGSTYKRLEGEENILFAEAMGLGNSIPITPTPLEIVEKQCEVVPTLACPEGNNGDEITRLKNEIHLKNLEINSLKNIVNTGQNCSNRQKFCPPGSIFAY